VHADADVLLYLRETADERILVQASRASHPAMAIDAEAIGLRTSAGAVFGDEPLSPHGGRVTFPDEGPAFRAWRLA
jgi:alpha-glucosidase